MPKTAEKIDFSYEFLARLLFFLYLFTLIGRRVPRDKEELYIEKNRKADGTNLHACIFL